MWYVVIWLTTYTPSVTCGGYDCIISVVMIILTILSSVAQSNMCRRSLSFN